ncbi:hypothetical protein TRAPUB_2872 [Trametes pubescens]|uniref:Uncharacterized protein n=1 Tax=Trametes pubescens TaxID=154538 RepID=A0A1M2VFA9_TRAPU|nr:hypothetical protein TRAPUB_2872 [Trametes pubescens]
MVPQGAAPPERGDIPRAADLHLQLQLGNDYDALPRHDAPLPPVHARGHLEDGHVGALVVMTIPGLKTLHVESKMEAASPILGGFFWGLHDLRTLSLTQVYIWRPEIDVLAALPRLKSLSAMAMLPRS